MIDGQLIEMEEESDDFIKLLAKKAHFMNNQGYLKYYYPFTMPCTKFEEVINILRPYKMNKLCVYPYLEALFLMNECRSDCLLKVKYLHEAEKIMIDYYKGSNEPIIRSKELFDIPKQWNSFNYHQYHAGHYFKAFQNFRQWVRFPEEDMCFVESDMFYAISALRSFSIATRDKEPVFFLRTVLQILFEVIVYTRSIYRFKQLNHLLAIAMHHTTKLEQVIPQQNQNELKNMKGMLSYHFAYWGLNIVNRSSPNFVNTGLQTSILNNYYEEITNLIEPGVKQYENLFPIETVGVRQHYQILRECQVWNNRAIELIPNTVERQAPVKQRELLNFIIKATYRPKRNVKLEFIH